MRSCRFSVEDDGAGFDPGASAGPPHQLATVRRREGERLTIDSARERGTRVTARHPVDLATTSRSRVRDLARRAAPDALVAPRCSAARATARRRAASRRESQARAATAPGSRTPRASEARDLSVVQPATERHLADRERAEAVSAPLDAPANSQSTHQADSYAASARDQRELGWRHPPLDVGLASSASYCDLGRAALSFLLVGTSITGKNARLRRCHREHDG